MKNFRKKLATALTAALVISTMAVSASAVNVAQIKIGSGNGVLSNLGSLCTDPEALESASGLDIQKLLEDLGLNGSTTSNAANGNCDLNTQNALTSAPAANSAQTNTAAVKQNTGDSTVDTKTATADTSVEDAAVSDTTDSACTGGSCTSNTDCNAADSNCGTDEVCITGSCLNGTGTCGSVADAGTTCTANATLLDRLNSIISKLGIDFQNACLNLSGDGDTTVTETPQPSQGTETPQPSQGTDTPATEPEDDGDSTPAGDTNIDNQSFEQQVVTLVNEQRAANGLAPLTLNAALSNVARAKSQDMHDNNYFSHTSPTYGSPFDMMKAAGISYRTAGENIAMGYGTPQAVMNGWMNSPGHRANILNANYTQIGVGYVADGNYWTQEFIG